MSHLFTNPDWPESLPDNLEKKLKTSLTSSFPNRLLRPDNFYRNIKALRKKKASGRDVSFTDFFGYVIGQTLQNDVCGPLFILIFMFIIYEFKSSKLFKRYYVLCDVPDLDWQIHYS